MGEPLLNRPDHYELLGVPRDAPVEEIMLAYRLVVRTILAHPELAGDDWNLAVAEDAFHVLSHADLRADYDRWLAESEGRPPVVVTPRAYLPIVPGEPRPSSPAPTSTALVTAAPRAVFPVFATTASPAASPPAKSSAPNPPADDSRSPYERRALTRLRREGQVTGRLPDGRTFTAALRDVSPRGLSFVSAQAIDVGTELELRSEALLATSIVRDSRPCDEGPEQHVVGVEFQRVEFRVQRGTFLSTSA